MLVFGKAWVRRKRILSKLKGVHNNINSRFSSALPIATKTYLSQTGEMRQKNAKQLAQAHSTAEKYKQNTGLQAHVCVLRHIK